MGDVRIQMTTLNANWHWLLPSMASPFRTIPYIDRSRTADEVVNSSYSRRWHSRFLYKTRLYNQYGTELTLVRLSLWFEQIRKVYLPHSKLVCSTPRSAKLTAWTNLVEYDRRLLPLINVLCPTRVYDFFQWPYTYTSQTIEQSGPRLADGFVRKQVRNIQYYTLYLCRCRSCFLSSYTIS